MSTRLSDLAKMIRLGAPHLIHSDDELTEYTAALFKLTGKDETTRHENEAIELLTVLIERYEADRLQVPKADPVTVRSTSGTIRLFALSNLAEVSQYSCFTDRAAVLIELRLKHAHQAASLGLGVPER